MIKKSKSFLLYLFFIILLLCFCATTVYLLVRVCSISNDVTNLKQQIIDLCQSRNTNNIDSHTSDIIGQTSILLSICSATICLFGLFGIIVSFINLKMSKELEVGIRNAEEAIETQKDLQAWRLIQEGRNYKTLKRLKYAKECFDTIIKENKDSELYYVAKFEKLSLYEEYTTSADAKELAKIISDFKHFYEEMRNLSNLNNIKLEVNFFLGAFYGNLSKRYDKESELSKKYIKYSISCFERAIELDPKNPDLYRNASISYALAEQKETCLAYLSLARRLSENEMLYKPLVTSRRLSDMYKDYSDCISSELKQELGEKFNIYF